MAKNPENWGVSLISRCRSLFIGEKEIQYFHLSPGSLRYPECHVRGRSPAFIDDLGRVELRDSDDSGKLDLTHARFRQKLS